jgi:pSer/pThr/pTyr-binding forkhead associated (FHA) protein
VTHTEAWLVDERWAKAYPLLGDATTIGRDGECTIILRDPSVSRHHASIERRENSYHLRPTGAAGTKLNGAQVATESPLQEGDRIEIAFTILRFTLKAPTGEMFVIRRDRPTPYDHPEVPTKAPLRVSTAALRVAKRYWHLVLSIALLVVMLLVLLATHLR